MRKHLSVAFFLTFLFLVTASFPAPVSAASSLGAVNYKGTANATIGWTVTNPGNAHDWNNATSADFVIGSVADPGGQFQVITFTVATGETAPPSDRIIAFVDFKMNYYCEGGQDDDYRIVYYVDPSGTEVVLQDWTTVAHAAATDVWYDQDDPNDLSWSWSDIPNIRFVVKGTDGPNDRNNRVDFEEYEAWVTVYYYRKPTLTVDAPDTTQSAAFTVNVTITDADSLYAWEFRLLYDTTKLTATNIDNTTGTFFDGYDNPNMLKSDINDTAGRVWAGLTLTGDVQGKSGSGKLAIISFDIDASGTSNLNLSNTKLVGYDYMNKRTFSMIHTTVDDSVDVTVGVPEFPLGAALEIGLVSVIIYVWWRKKRKPITQVHKTPL